MKRWWWSSLRFQLVGGKKHRDLEIRDPFQLNIIGYRDGRPAFCEVRLVPTLSGQKVRVMAVTVTSIWINSRPLRKQTEREGTEIKFVRIRFVSPHLRIVE